MKMPRKHRCQQIHSLPLILDDKFQINKSISEPRREFDTIRTKNNCHYICEFLEW